MINFMSKEHYDFEDLRALVAFLRSENGCPWDREQTHKSLRRDFIEETYEVIEAIDKEDPVLLREELGDALLQIVMHARIEEEEGRTNFQEIAGDVCRKMIHRHPHVFGDVNAETSEQVLKNCKKVEDDCEIYL